MDGYQPEPSLRSKIKVTKDETPPDWSFDGSSTQQAKGGSSDCLLLPVQTYDGPLYADQLVMCEVQTGERKTHVTNTRAAAAAVVAVVRRVAGAAAAQTTRTTTTTKESSF